MTKRNENAHFWKKIISIFSFYFYHYHGFGKINDILCYAWTSKTVVTEEIDKKKEMKKNFSPYFLPLNCVWLFVVGVTNSNTSNGTGSSPPASTDSPVGAPEDLPADDASSSPEASVSPAGAPKTNAPAEAPTESAPATNAPTESVPTDAPTANAPTETPESAPTDAPAEAPQDDDDDDDDDRVWAPTNAPTEEPEEGPIEAPEGGPIDDDDEDQVGWAPSEAPDADGAPADTDSDADDSEQD